MSNLISNIFYLFLIITINCLAIYLILHTLSYALTVLASFKYRKLINKNKYIYNDYLNNIITIVYCHNQEKASAYMLEALNKQNYPKTNCQFHFILDNCTDNSANMLEFISGAKIWKVGDGVTIGKDDAISWLLERLIHVKNTDAFVFLDVERQIDENFLSAINKSLFSNDVIVGETDIITEDASLFSILTKTLNKYTDRIIKTGRSLLGWGNFIDTNCFVMKHSILEEIKYVDFKSSMSAYEYTLLLAKKSYICAYDPNVKSKVPISQYFDSQETFSNKFALFSSSFFKAKTLFPKFNFKYNELTLYMISPSSAGLALLMAVMLTYTAYFVFWLDFPIFVSASIVLLLCFGASICICKFSLKEKVLLSTYFISKFWFKMLNSQIISKMQKIIKGEKVVPVVKTATREVIVTDGKNNLKCELELINEDGMSRAVLKFKRKKYVSEYYLRMYDAINDIVSTLTEHGFRVKICVSCGYFTSLVDGTTNMIKGTCNKCVVDKISETPKEVLLWSSCENFIPQEINKVIDISSFRANN